MNYLVNLIKSSELKAGLILSFFGIIFNFVYKNIEEVEKNIIEHWWLGIFAVAWIVFTLISMYYSVRSFVPRIMDKYEPNLFFFGDIISKFGDIKSYSETFLDHNVEKVKLYEQLGQQIFINSQITAAKFKNVNKSIKNLVYSLIILVVIVLIQATLTIIKL